MSWILLGTKLIPLVVSAVQAVEKLGGKKGTDKQDAAVEHIEANPDVADAGLDLNVLRDPEVRAALRGLISAIVTVLNAIAKQRGAA